jgi:hypothetical protein
MISQDIVKAYHVISVKMANGSVFTVECENNEGKKISAVTNISDMDYKSKLDERAWQEKTKKKTKDRATDRKKVEENKAVENGQDLHGKENSVAAEMQDGTVTKTKKKARPGYEGEESAIVKYNKTLIAEEEANK